jgi:hypothetical protein
MIRRAGRRVANFFRAIARGIGNVIEGILDEVFG